MAGVRFLKHNIRDDFDDLTDVARLYGIRAVPCFVFFIGGAQVFIHPFIHSSHAFQSADQVRCSTHSMAALQPALSSGFLHHVNGALQTAGLP